MNRLILQSLILIFATLTNETYSQSDTLRVWINVTNKNDNDLWYEHIKTLTKEQQLESIQKRLLIDAEQLTNDTSSTTPHQIGQLPKIDFYCRPFLKVNGRDILINKSDQARLMASILDSIDFNKIEIITPEMAKEKYGKWGLCGVILMTTTDKRIDAFIKDMGL